MSKQSRGWGDIAERISPVWELLEAEVDVESKTQLSTCFGGMVDKTNIP